jgi:acid stress-induced BolA-like protein IbaG/YrbA
MKTCVRITDVNQVEVYYNNDEELQVCEVYRKLLLLKRKQNIYITLMKKLKRRLVHCFQNNMLKMF